MSYVLFSTFIPTMSENALANDDFYRWQSNAKAFTVGRSRAPRKSFGVLVIRTDDVCVSILLPLLPPPPSP